MMTVHIVLYFNRFSFVHYRNVIDVVDDTMLVFDPKESSDDFFFHGQRQQRRDLNKKVNRDQKFAFDTVYGPNSTNGDIFEGTYIYSTSDGSGTQNLGFGF